MPNEDRTYELTVASQDLLLRIADGVAYATINRPQARNALSSPVREALFDFLGQVRDDDQVRVVLLRASGPGFVAGGDIKAFGEGLTLTAKERADDMRRRAAGAGALCEAIASLPKPVVVAARGAAVGVGVSMILAADLALVSDTTKLRLSHVTLGISPDGAATWFLPREVGLKRANQIAMLGDVVSAEEALSMGLVNWVVPDAELDAGAEALARRLADGAPQALAGTKQLIQSSMGCGLAAQVEAEAESMWRCAMNPDYAEGLRAVLEKRPPVFEGQPFRS